MAQHEEQGRPALAAEAARAYLTTAGVRCPYCGSYDLDAGATTTYDDTKFQEVRCGGCAARWRDVYQLTGVETLGDDGEPDAAFERPLPGVLVEVRAGVAQVSSHGDVEVALVDWDEVDDSDDPQAIRDLRAEVRALPAECDEGGAAVLALTQRLATLAPGQDDE